MAFKWYNPMTWGFFGFTDPTTGDYVEVDLEVGGKRTKAGVRVTAKTALSISMVWSCVKILSESLSGLPLKLYEDKEGGRALVTGSDRMLAAAQAEPLHDSVELPEVRGREHGVARQRVRSD